MASKGKLFLEVVRPDLNKLETRNVQARVTIGLCDESGIPRRKDSWFVVTPRCDRQVQMGSQKQGRSSCMPGFEAWNAKVVEVIGKDGKPVVDSNGEIQVKLSMGGRKRFRLSLQHLDINDAYTVGCKALRGSNADPKPPGKTPFCTTSDGVTARRWTGIEFADIPCAGKTCAYREYTGSGNSRVKAAKTVFSLTGRLAEDDFEPLLVMVSTGSDFNLHEFVGLVEKVEDQWRTICERTGVTIPLNWYGLPLELTIYEGVGDETRFPRINFALAVDLEMVFRLSVDQTNVFRQIGQAYTPSAAQLLLPEIQEAADNELFQENVAEPTRQMSSRDRLMALVNSTDAQQITIEHE